MKTNIELYTTERLNILNKIFEILDINENNNNTFFLKDLDNDEKKQNQILALVEFVFFHH